MRLQRLLLGLSRYWANPVNSVEIEITELWHLEYQR